MNDELYEKSLKNIRLFFDNFNLEKNPVDTVIEMLDNGEITQTDFDDCLYSFIVSVYLDYHNKDLVSVEFDE